MSKKMLRVDFHTHIISEEFPNFVEKFNDDRFPTFERTCECGAEIMVKGKSFRKLTNQAWDMKKRIEDMDREGVDIQVLSPIPVTFSYWSDPIAALEISQFQNDFIASIVKENPDRFMGLGTVPLQNVDLAIQEMKRAICELGLQGIEIGSNVNGLNLDDPTLYEFFKEAANLEVPIFVHPWATLGKERLEQYNLMYTVGMPSETALAAASVIMSGMLDKLPNLKLCFAHGGGSLPYLLPRLEKGWEVWPHLRKINEPPSFYAKKLFYDTLVYDPENLKFMIDRLGSTQIIAGTDYPFLLREAPAGKVVDDLLSLTENQKRLLIGQNALEFLGIHERINS